MDGTHLHHHHEVLGMNKQDDIPGSLPSSQHQQHPGVHDVTDNHGGQQQYTGSQHAYHHQHYQHAQQHQQQHPHQQQQQQQQLQQQYNHYGSWNGQGGGGGGGGGAWSTGVLNPGIPGVECTDADIIISTGLEHSRTREANLEYQRLLLANTVLFGSLPSHYQSVHAQHIYHFLTHVRGRRFLQCIAPNVYVPFNGGPFQIAQEITGDPCKMAFQSRNPLWLLDGMRWFTSSADPPLEQSWIHRSNPRGNDWTVVNVDQVKEILKSEGPVHLLILPKGIDIKPALEDSKQNTENIDNKQITRLNGEYDHVKDQERHDAQSSQQSIERSHDHLGADDVEGVEDGVAGDEGEHTIPDIPDDNMIDDAALGDVSGGTHSSDDGHLDVVTDNNLSNNNNNNTAPEDSGDKPVEAPVVETNPIQSAHDFAPTTDASKRPFQEESSFDDSPDSKRFRM